jgi:hypothetical protein
VETQEIHWDNKCLSGKKSRLLRITMRKGGFFWSLVFPATSRASKEKTRDLALVQIDITIRDVDSRAQYALSLESHRTPRVMEGNPLCILDRTIKTTHDRDRFIFLHSALPLLSLYLFRCLAENGNGEVVV